MPTCVADALVTIGLQLYMVGEEECDEGEEEDVEVPKVCPLSHSP